MIKADGNNNKKLAGMNLCIAATQEVMPLHGGERIEFVIRAYKKAAKKYPEQWAELTLACLQVMIEKSASILPAEKVILSEFLQTAALRYDEIQS